MVAKTGTPATLVCRHRPAGRRLGSMFVRRGLTPEAYRRITALALVALAVIIVTGAAVRLTCSGLGCTDWPNCSQGQFVAQVEYHQMIEFVNRVFTGVVSVAVILAATGSLRRTPRRVDLTWWSFGLVGGVVGQIVLGALVVLFELSPWLVIGHFVLSMTLVWNAVVLHHRAALATSADGHALTGRHVVAPRHLALARIWFLLSIAVIGTGTIVTGSGPHGGDERVERLPVLFKNAARVHGSTVMIFLVLTLVLIHRLRAATVNRHVQRALWQVLGVLAAQATIGYVQYFTKVPVVLVGFHIAGATLLWISVVRFMLSTRETSTAARIASARVGVVV